MIIYKEGSQIKILFSIFKVNFKGEKKHAHTDEHAL